MAGLFKRGNVYYAVFYSGGRKRRKSLKTSSVQRARKKLVELEQALEDGHPVGGKKDIAVDDFTPMYLEHIKTHKRAHTTKTLAHEWTRFVEWLQPVKLGDVSLETWWVRK